MSIWHTYHLKGDILTKELILYNELTQDGRYILSDFCDVIAAEIRLPAALNRKLLCPFQYFGISDNVDLKNIKWQNGKYSPNELTVYSTSKNLTSPTSSAVSPPVTSL